MVFSLFEENRPIHKVQLKNCNKVVSNIINGKEIKNRFTYEIFK